MRLKNDSILTAIVVGVLCVSSAPAQPSVIVSIGANAPFAHSSLAEEEVFSYLWPVGFDLGASVDIPFTRWLLLNPTVVYRIYPFGGVNEDDLAQIDAEHFASSGGEPTQQIFLGLGLRLEDPAESSSLLPFLQVSGGYEIERVGKVIGQWQQISNGSLVDSEWPTGYRHNWTFLAGIGFVAHLSPEFSLQPSVLWHGSGRDRNYTLGTLDLVYRIIL